MEMNRCMQCMHPLSPGQTVCPACGSRTEEAKQLPFALARGTRLNGKYLVGNVIGQGGFGITYVGMDLVLNLKVAIKEYFPMSLGSVSRNGTVSSLVTWRDGEASRQEGIDSFLKEARKMAKLNAVPSIVTVRDMFVENETAYIVMDFAEGETLKEKILRGGPMAFRDCIDILAPMIRSLKLVHGANLIHRDISPDNIMIDPSGAAVLLDMGAAKDMVVADGHHSQMVAKHGFSPPEQYMQTGDIGPWSDVYAMAATIYYCTTGIQPPAAPDRTFEDPLALAPPLTPGQFGVLQAGMGFDPDSRIQDMDALLERLQAAADGRAEPVPEAPAAASPAGKIAVAVLGILAAAAVTAAAFLAVQQTRGGQAALQMPVETEPALVQTAPETIPETLPETEPETLPETQPETEPVTEPETQPETEPVVADTRKINYFANVPVDKTLGVYVEMFTPFWGQLKIFRSAVTEIVFRDELGEVPLNAFDVSRDKDGSVMAWMTGNLLTVAADGIIQLPEDSSGIFYAFSNLKKINFGNCVDTSQVTDMRMMFYQCTVLPYVDLSTWNTANVTDMSAMFYGCEALYGVDLSGFDTSRVTDMSAMFYQCRDLTMLDLSSMDVSNVTRMDSMFENCTYLENLDIQSWNTANVTDMNYMFRNCRRLETVNLGQLDTSSVTSMREMFTSCWQLTDVDLSTWDTSHVTDMLHMFTYCSGLNRVNAAGWDVSQLETLEQMFYSCSSLTSVNLSGWNPSAAVSTKEMFRDCPNLLSLNLSGWDVPKLKNMDFMFRDCRRLTSIDMSRWDASGVPYMQLMFSGCPELEELKTDDAKLLNMFAMRK